MDLKDLINDGPPPEKKRTASLSLSHTASPDSRRASVAINGGGLQQHQPPQAQPSPLPPPPQHQRQQPEYGYGYAPSQGTPLYAPPPSASSPARSLTPLQTSPHPHPQSYPYPYPHSAAAQYPFPPPPPPPQYQAPQTQPHPDAQQHHQHQHQHSPAPAGHYATYPPPSYATYPPPSYAPSPLHPSPVSSYPPPPLPRTNSSIPLSPSPASRYSQQHHQQSPHTPHTPLQSARQRQHSAAKMDMNHLLTPTNLSSERESEAGRAKVMVGSEGQGVQVLKETQEPMQPPILQQQYQPPILHQLQMQQTEPTELQTQHLQHPQQMQQQHIQQTQQKPMHQQGRQDTPEVLPQRTSPMPSQQEGAAGTSASSHEKLKQKSSRPQQRDKTLSATPEQTRLVFTNGTENGGAHIDVPLEHEHDLQKMSSSQKRPADFEGSADQDERPAKMSKLMDSKRHKYADVRPPWARYAPSNERFAEKMRDRPGRIVKNNSNGDAKLNANGNGAATTQKARVRQARRSRSPQPPQQQHEQRQKQKEANGTPPPNQLHNTANGNSTPPWQRDPPLDDDLLHARRLLGPWEKTLCWRTPYPDLLQAVQDWLYLQLSALNDVGSDLRQGSIEIEAKIGRLLVKGGRPGEDERIQLPVASMCVLDQTWVEKFARFESEMDEHEHRTMNAFLNTSTQASCAPGRVGIRYTHPRSVDSFLRLSPAGLASLPPAFKRQHRPNRDRDLHVRTTVSLPSGDLTARIVKLDIAHLHLFNPRAEYDCRISINLEANLLHSALPLVELTLPSSSSSSAPEAASSEQPDRNKDRVSYKHLAYSIDLTRVDVSGRAPKFEAELEVDAEVLREQMGRLERGEESAFGDVVSGFLDDATFLMRQRRGVA